MVEMEVMEGVIQAEVAKMVKLVVQQIWETFVPSAALVPDVPVQVE